MRRRSNLLAAEAGLALSLGLVLAAFHADFPASGDPRSRARPAEPERIEVPPAPRTVQVREVPPAPPSALPPVEAPDAEIAVDDWGEETALPTLDADPAGLATPPPPRPPDLPLLNPPSDEPVDFLAIEQMPRLIGGIEGLQRQIRYPERCRMLGLEGRVFVQFVVEKDGTVTDASVVRGIGGGCDAAALEAIRAARFTPGHQRGRPVRVRMSLPATFRLH